jgi:hypothetical protein
MKTKIIIYTAILTVIFAVVLNSVFFFFDRTHQYDFSNFTLGWWSGLFYLSCRDFYNKALKKSIPLTHDKMLEFGFTSVIDGDWITYELDGFVIGGKNKNTLRLSTKESVTILYVHELQNLVFALTGNELTIN